MVHYYLTSSRQRQWKCWWARRRKWKYWWFLEHPSLSKLNFQCAIWPWSYNSLGTCWCAWKVGNYFICHSTIDSYCAWKSSMLSLQNIIEVQDKQNPNENEKHFFTNAFKTLDIMLCHWLIFWIQGLPVDIMCLLVNMKWLLMFWCGLLRQSRKFTTI